MFYEKFIWWFLLFITSILGFVQLIGFYGRGSGSQKIERYTHLIILLTFLVSFFIVGFWGGICFIIIFIVLNSSIIKYLVKMAFKKYVGYVPSERKEIRKKIFEEKIKNLDSFSIDDVEKETKNRLNIKD